MIAGKLEPVTVTQPGGVVDPLDPNPPAPNQASTVTIYASVLPNGTNETRGSDRDTVMTTYRLFAPGRADIRRNSTVTWHGFKLDVLGDPEFWPDPMGGAGHTEVVVSLVRG